MDQHGTAGPATEHGGDRPPEQGGSNHIAEAMQPHMLLRYVDGLPPSTIVGFEPDEHHLAVHVTELPADDRAGSAGLFGVEVPEEWTAMAAVLDGVARRLDSDTVSDHGPLCARVVVTRDGQVASAVDAPGPLGEELEVPGAPEGLIVDALHRVMGLPSPGDPPPPVAVTLGVWAHSILNHLFEHGEIDWDTAVDLHPGEPGRSQNDDKGPRVPGQQRSGHQGSGRINPSVETLVEATLRCGDDLDWAGFHQRATERHGCTADLTPDEAAWMDSTMFARWVVGSLPEPSLLVGLLRSSSAPECAEALTQVLDRVGEVTRSPRR